MELLDQVREVIRKKHYPIQYSERTMGIGEFKHVQF